MQLTSQQQATVKNWLDTNAVGLGDQAAADLLNTTASPAYLVWQTIIKRTIVQSATAFDWTRVDNLSVGKARIWDWMFNQVDQIEPWRGNFRTGINAVWVGTAQDLAVRDAVNGACQRSVTNFEKLFVQVTSTGPTQSGTRGTFGNADTLGIDASGAFIEGKITSNQVAEIRG